MLRCSCKGILQAHKDISRVNDITYPYLTKTSDNLKGSSPSPQQYLRFYKIGIFFTAAFGLYLGIHGLYLIIVENNLISGVPLFAAALLIAPPPIGISGMLKEKFNVDLSMALRLIAATLMLFIAWLTLP